MRLNRFGNGFVALTASALVLSACSGGSTTSESTAVVTSSSASSPASSTADASAHNDADVAFARGMIPHHEQAVEMSDMLLGKQGVDPAVVSLANEIRAAQQPEIEQMQGWLQQWGESATPSMGGSDMPEHDMPGHSMPGHDMSGGGMGEMPAMGGGSHGMMSEADMAALQNAQGAEAGTLFLEQMIEHHEGAVTMAQQEIDNGQFPAAVEMAHSIVAAQQAEIEEMRALLAK
ncbi:DUF305 domain-containing protein [Mycobacterium sp. NPDC003323]